MYAFKLLIQNTQRFILTAMGVGVILFFPMIISLISSILPIQKIRKIYPLEVFMS